MCRCLCVYWFVFVMCIDGVVRGSRIAYWVILFTHYTLRRPTLAGSMCTYKINWQILTPIDFIVCTPSMCLFCRLSSLPSSKSLSLSLLHAYNSTRQPSTHTQYSILDFSFNAWTTSSQQPPPPPINRTHRLQIHTNDKLRLAAFHFSCFIFDSNKFISVAFYHFEYFPFSKRTL